MKGLGTRFVLSSWALSTEHRGLLIVKFPTSQEDGRGSRQDERVELLGWDVLVYREERVLSVRVTGPAHLIYPALACRFPLSPSP